LNALAQALSGDVFAALLVFARVGSAVMLLPGFGELFVPPRVRLLFGGAIALLIAPAVSGRLPPLPPTGLELMVLFGGEIAVGLFLGTLARILLAALHVAGGVIGVQSSLSSALMFDPASSSQNTLHSGFFYLLGIMVIFTADLHHPMLLAVAQSYSLFTPGAPLPTGDFSELGVRYVAQSFALAMQIAAPYIVVGIVFYVGLGLIARLMPQVQVFFIALPLQIAISVFLMVFTLAAGVGWFMNSFESAIGGFIVPR
jgi:flagellar biosynthetic protein FliR